MSYGGLYQNATMLITDFAKSATTRVDDLYAGVNVQQLNWLEQLWMRWYNYVGNPILATGIMAFLMHEVSRRHLDAAACANGSKRARAPQKTTKESKGTDSLFTDRLLWTVYPMDDHRRDTLLQAVEDPTRPSSSNCLARELLTREWQIL